MGAETSQTENRTLSTAQWHFACSSQTNQKVHIRGENCHKNAGIFKIYVEHMRVLTVNQQEDTALSSYTSHRRCWTKHDCTGKIIEKQRGIFSKAKVNPFTPGRPSENRFKNQGSSQLCLLCGDTTSKESVWRRDQHHSYMFGRTGASVIDFGTNLSIQKRRQEEDARAQLQQQLKAASKVAHISLWENQGEQVAQRTQVRQMELRPICLVAS